MMSRAHGKQMRKPPEERRAEIVATAADIALAEGLERITLRAVAETLGVRPGLISHYFPAAEDLVVEALDLAIRGDRETLFPMTGTPTQRIARLVREAQSTESRNLARLWLNARHLARFRPAVADSVAVQETLNRERLTAVIDEGIRSGEFRATDAPHAADRILTGIDGVGSYVNTTGDQDQSLHTTLVTDIAEWALGLEAGTLRDALGTHAPLNAG